MAKLYEPFRIHPDLLEFSDNHLHEDLLDLLENLDKESIEKFGDDIYRLRIFSDQFLKKVRLFCNFVRS